MSRLRAGCILFGLVAALALLVRVPSIAEPLGIDQSLWASAARGLSRGQALYRDVWDQKPPGLFLTYRAAFSLGGWTPASIAWLDILASAGTALLLFLIARRLDGPFAGTLTAAMYAAFTVPSWLYRHGGFLERSVAETFIVLCVSAAAWCAIHLHRAPAIYAAGLGLAAGAAVMYKPNAVLYFPALLIWLAAYAGVSRGVRVRAAMAACGAALIAPGLVFAWLWTHGVLTEARVALIEFNRFYVTEGLSLQGYPLEFSKAVWLRIKTDPLWCAGALGTLFAAFELLRSKRLPPAPGLAIAWGAAAALAIVANGVRLYNSYFIQAAAPLALLGAWFLVESFRRSAMTRIVGAGAVSVMLLQLLVWSNYPRRVYEFARTDLEGLRGGRGNDYLDVFGGYANGRGYSARANAELAGYVRERTTENQTIYLFGINGAGIYFASDRLTAHRFLRVNFFYPASFPAPEFDLAAVARTLAARRPVYLIFERLHSPTALGRAVDSLEQRPEVVSLLSAYRLETRIEDFTLYRLIE